MATGKYGIQYDEQGFLIGVKIKVNNIDNNVAEILEILKGSTSDFVRRYAATEKKTERLEVQREKKIKQYIGNHVEQVNRNIKQLEQSLNRSSQSKQKSNRNIVGNKTKDFQLNAVSQAVNEVKPPPLPNMDNQDNRQDDGYIDAGGRLRDSKGRFIGGANKTNDVSTFGKFLSVFKQVGQIAPDTQGLDPTIEAIRETWSMLEPVKRLAGSYLKPTLSSFFKNRKRAEPLPKEQTEHNKKRLKLLKMLIDKLSGGSSSLLKRLLNRKSLRLLSSLLSLGLSLGKKGVKGGWKWLKKGLKLGGKLLKRVPVVGTLLTALDLMDWKNKSTSEKGGSVGAIIGGVIGGAVGFLFGGVGAPVGAFLGGLAGEFIGSAIAPYLSDFVDGLSKYGVIDGLKKLWDWGIEKIKSWFSGDGELTSADMPMGASDGSAASLLPPTSDGKAISKILKTGNGFNIVQLADGSVERRNGNIAWRNNNAGNLRYGKGWSKAAERRAIANGAIGVDDKGFAIYRTREEGEAAQRRLLRNKFGNSNLWNMINDYAPPNENDTVGYYKFLLSKGLNPNKTISQYSEDELNRLQQAIWQKEGYRAGQTVQMKAPDKTNVSSKLGVPTINGDLTTSQKPTGVGVLKQPYLNNNSIKVTSSVNVPPSQAKKAGEAMSNTIKMTFGGNPQSSNIKVPVNSQTVMPKVMIAQDQTDISQNIADPLLAQVITGGIGLINVGEA